MGMIRQVRNWLAARPLLSGALGLGLALLAIYAFTGPNPPDIPADGKIHILERRGTFQVTPKTIFCGDRLYINSWLYKKIHIYPANLNAHDPGVGHGLAKLSEARHIDPNPLRYTGFDDDNCTDNGVNVVFDYSFGPNRDGKPYAKVLSARQGQALVTLAYVYKPDYALAESYAPPNRALVYSRDFLRDDNWHSHVQMGEKIIQIIFDTQQTTHKEQP
jgi:hypothetical protein